MLACKNCTNKQEQLNEYDKLVNICTLDGHEVRESIESCDNDTSANEFKL